ncbi:hypothetical protein CXF68_20370 [Tenacibaculum sp. Bg11-29]|uniref:hypothetical protein n=1 Tax=Tenacibaculum sp. Bg11-29 TaxID=2058306 RepID=UPI000C329426|nr:hypothetical protein [Tenacibaculum sp. Bg11-29]PKH52910.1 hypothetical protein CXF68_20370 [Tenacibaculum sp. Bg11-29]
MNSIHEFETIEELKEFLESDSSDELRTNLLKEFDGLVNYKNIKEWNKLVRICESLSIIGWGKREAFEATADKWINGSYYTEIRNKLFEQKLEWSKGWSKQKNTFVIYENESDKTNYEISIFASQRNKLPKSPIRWSRSGNYQKSLQPLIDSLEVLRNKVIRETRPELYGNSFSYIGLNLYFSNHDSGDLTVRSEYFHKEEDIPTNLKGKKNEGDMPAYYIRPKFKIGRLSTKKDELKLVVTRHFTREFGEFDLIKQKEILKIDFIEIIDTLSDKLKKKKVDYNTELLKLDTIKIFSKW